MRIEQALRNLYDHAMSPMFGAEVARDTMSQSLTEFGLKG